MIQLFNKLFEIRDTLHLTHLYQADRKLSTHLALGSAYESILDLVDQLVECYSGLYGQQDISIPSSTRTDNPMKYLMTSYQSIETMRKGISESFLQNIIDEIQAEIARTLYKLKFVQ